MSYKNLGIMYIVCYTLFIANSRPMEGEHGVAEYRLKETFEEKDTELLLGHKIEPERFEDYNLARVLDKIYEAGTQRIFTQIAQNAIGSFSIDTSRLHYDTTSISVYGDYDGTLPFNITYGQLRHCTGCFHLCGRRGSCDPGQSCEGRWAGNRKLAGRKTALTLQRPERHRKEFRFSQRSGDRQQHLFKKAPPYRGTGPDLAHILADLASNGAFHAPVCKNLWVDDRLGKQTHQKTYFLYDDHQVYPYTRHKVR